MTAFNQIQVYPRIAFSNIIIEGFENNKFSATVLHAFGKEQPCLIENTGQINVSGLVSGIYFVKLEEKSRNQSYYYKFEKV